MNEALIWCCVIGAIMFAKTLWCVWMLYTRG